MTDLSSLIAKLGDCPKTTSYRNFAAMLRKSSVVDVEQADAAMDAADAALLELAGKWKRCDEFRLAACRTTDFEKKRAEAAEADLALCFHDKDAAEQRLMQAEAQLLREEQGADEAVKHIMELETDVERLRCCGNCGEIGDCLDSDSDGRQHCEPSRWASREEAGDE